MTQPQAPTAPEPFATVLAELRAPIVSIQGHVRTLMARDDGLAAPARAQLHQHMLQHTQRLESLVDDVVLYMRLLVGPVDVTPEDIRVHALVEDLRLRLGEPERVTNEVPSDLVVAVLSRLVPTDVVQKLLLVGTFVAAGWGSGRLVGSGRAAASAAAAFYCWNAFVYERLVIGHWALLIGYAALPWVVLAARRWRRGRDDGPPTATSTLEPSDARRLDAELRAFKG